MKTKKFSFDVNEILNSQQNKFPLMFIDRIVSLKPGKELKAIKNFTYNEWFFPAHFEGEPNVPGFIQVECMAQAFIMTFSASLRFVRSFLPAAPYPLNVKWWVLRLISDRREPARFGPRK